MKLLDLDAIANEPMTKDSAALLRSIVAATVADHQRLIINGTALHVETLKTVEAINAAT